MKSNITHLIKKISTHKELKNKKIKLSSKDLSYKKTYYFTIQVSSNSLNNVEITLNSFTKITKLNINSIFFSKNFISLISSYTNKQKVLDELKCLFELTLETLNNQGKNNVK